MDGTCRKSYPVVGFRIDSFEHPCSVPEIFIYLFLFLMDRDCVVSTATGLRARRPGARIPAGARDLFRQGKVQTSSGTHPASCSVGTGVVSRGVKRGRVLPQSLPPSAEVNSEWSYTSFLP